MSLCRYKIVWRRKKYASLCGGIIKLFIESLFLALVNHIGLGGIGISYSIAAPAWFFVEGARDRKKPRN